MNRNLAIFSSVLVVGLLVITSYSFMSLEHNVPESFLKGRNLDISVCSCDSTVNLSSNNLKFLSQSFLDSTSTSGLKIIVPQIQSISGENFVVSAFGLSWLSMSYFPATYRYEYRIADQEFFFEENHQEIDEFIEILSSSNCINSPGYKKVYDLNIPVDKSSIAHESGFIEKYNKFLEDFNNGIVSVGDNVLFKLNCGPKVILGCMDEEACNYNPNASLSDESCQYLDKCGVCDGPGPIFECGCNDIKEGDCDCEGHKLDALGVCGGSCKEDKNGDGICDPLDLDNDGIPDEKDACPSKKSNSIYSNGCPFSVIHDENSLNFIITGTDNRHQVRFTLSKNGTVIKDELSTGYSVFPDGDVEANKLKKNMKDSEMTQIDITFIILDSSGKEVFTEEFKNYNYICISNGDCGFKKNSLF